MNRKLLLTITVLLCETFVRGAEHAPSRPGGGPDYWARKPIANPYCGKARNVMSAWMATPDVGKLEDKVRKALDDANAISIPQACSGGYPTPSDRKPEGPLVVINVWVDEGAVIALKSKLANLTKSADWSSRTSLAGVEASVEERWSALTRELAEKQALLRCSPHAVNLVKAEIARLEPFAKAYMETKDKSHLQVLIYEPR